MVEEAGIIQIIKGAGAIEVAFSVFAGIVVLGIIAAVIYSLVRCCCQRQESPNKIKIANFQPVADTESNFKDIEVGESSSRMTIINNYFKESRPIHGENGIS